MSAPKMVYEWGNRSFKADPQVVGETVTRIATNEGCCPPARLVQEARAKKSPLHLLFTWNNGEAADRWRAHEARQVIGGLIISVQTEDRIEKTPAFLSVGHTLKTQETGEGYRSISVVVEDPDLLEEALAEAKSRLEALRKRYEHLEALAPVWQALDQVAA